MISIIKWAGGKKQLLPELIKRMPKNYGKYVEPFVGSGALFFENKPQNAIINDFNPELINMYCQIRDNCNELESLLSRYQEEYNLLDEKSRKDYYYEKREIFNNNITNTELSIIDAALMIFLNKTCFNGLYRVNSAGFFNTPWGQKQQIKIYDSVVLNEASSILKKSLIMNSDFEYACSDLVSGDFVYFDPPYYDTFDTYQAGGFPEEDHIRLAELFKSLSEKGVYCMLSNSDHAFNNELYKEYNLEVVPVKRMINCDGKRRTGMEIIVCNYNY